MVIVHLGSECVTTCKQFYTFETGIFLNNWGEPETSLHVAPYVAAEDMVGFNKKDEPQKMIFSFVTFVFTELYYIHHVNHTTICLFFNSAII